MIEVEKLTGYFGNITAIEDVTFKVDKGEVSGLWCPNAGGKTTTMHILTRFLSASKEIARVANCDVVQSPLEVKKRIGYLPENPLLYAEMTVFSFLNFLTKIKGTGPQDRKQKINVAIKKGGLDDRIKSKYNLNSPWLKISLFDLRDKTIASFEQEKIYSKNKSTNQICFVKKVAKK